MLFQLTHIPMMKIQLLVNSIVSYIKIGFPIKYCHQEIREDVTIARSTSKTVTSQYFMSLIHLSISNP
jgi:hypothetical protein